MHAACSLNNLGYGLFEVIENGTTDRSYMTSYWSFIASTALFCVIFELLNIEECCNLASYCDIFLIV